MKRAFFIHISPNWGKKALSSLSSTLVLQALSRLCELTECDVRSCLNTLQFLARKGRPIKVSDLTGLHVGQKDINKGAFTIWQDLLQDKVSDSLSDHSIGPEASYVQSICELQ